MPAIQIKFASYVSLNRSTLKLLHASNYEAIRFGAVYNPAIALQLNMALPRASEKLSLQVTGLLSKYDFNGISVGLPAWITEEADIHVITIQGQMGIKYTYPKGRFRPTLMIGGDIMAFLHDDQKRTETTLRNGETVTFVYNEKIMARTLLGFNADLGIDYHISASVVSFFNIGYCRLSGNNAFNNVRNNNDQVMSILQSVHVSAGLYF